MYERFKAWWQQWWFQFTYGGSVTGMPKNFPVLDLNGVRVTVAALVWLQEAVEEHGCAGIKNAYRPEKPNARPS